MSAITKQIAAVEFHVNARQANAALESMRQSAEDAREEMTQLQEQANKGVKTVMVGGKDMDITKRIRDLNATAKAFEQAAQSQIKGVKAWDELWQHAKMGNIEQLTGQQIKAGVNGAKRQYDRLILGDEEDRRKAAAIRDIIDQANIVLDKLKGDTDKVIQTLSDGGHVADEVLQREKKNLEDMLSLTEKFSPEWQDYNRQLQAITKGIEEQAAQEKRLRGELVDANDARREAAKLDEDVARAAKKEHAAQQQKIDDAQKQMQQYQEERRQHQETAQKITDEIAKQDRQIASQSQLVDSIKRENHERTKKSNVMVQEADQADKTAAKAKRAADSSAKAVEKFSDRVQKAKDDVAKLQEQLDKSSDNDKQAVVIKLTKALDKQSKAEEDLKQKEKEAADAQEMYNRANADAIAKHEALDKAKAEGNKKLQEESQKLSQLQGKREANVASLNQEKEAIKQKNEAVDAQAKIINDAQQTQAKSRQLSIESIEKSIALLKQENRVIGDETNPQWVENEKTIGRLNRRLSEMKQHAAELRGEAMSVSQAMDMSNAASGSIEQMEKAISVLQQAQRATTNDVDVSRYTNAIDNLTQKLKEAKGEAVSLEEAMEMANVNSSQPYSIEEMQKGLKTLQEQQNTAIDPSKYTEAIDVLTQKIREAKGEAVSLQDALNFGKQGLDGSFKGTNEQLRQAKQILESTLTTTAKGSDRYKEIREALAGIAVEEKRVGEVSKEVQKILDAPKGHSFNELKVAVEQGRRELNSMTRTTKEGQKAYDELAAKVKAADLELKTLGNDSKGTQSSFEKAWSRLKTYVTLYMGTAVALQKLSGAIDDTMELSDKMGEVRKTTGFSADEVGRLSDNLERLDTRTPITELMDLSAAAGQLGLKTQEDIQGFTEAANEMLVALPEMGQDGATQMMKIAIATGEVDKIRKQMENGTIEGSSASAVAMEKIGSTIDRLRATTAAAAPPIADFVKRVGAVGAQSGITVDQVAALGATVDSLGMGTEMAGTAIARMIPAIKNNAFDIAKALGITPDSLRQLFATGKGMEAVLMVLEKMRDDGMDAKSIESFLGENGMSGLMKDLNQQGARAGIVFAGLSQNVDLLRQNLNTANQAYQDGTAIQQEYNKMNDTTAAKWERLKNKVEEFFVNNANQSFLGEVLDMLRKIADFITGSGGLAVGVRGLILLIAVFRMNVAGILKGALAVFPQIVNGIKLIGVQLGIVKAETAAVDATMKKMQWSNLLLAVAAAALYVAYSFRNMKGASQEASEELGKVRLQIDQAERQFDGYWKQIDRTSASMKKSQNEHNRLDAQVKRLTASTNKGSRATAILSSKERELRDSENKVTRASNEHRIAIANMNAIYGKYLGYLLTERNRALLAADAHEKIAKAIEKEMLMKQQEAAITSISSKNQQEIAQDFGDLINDATELGGGNSKLASQLVNDMQNFMRQTIYYDNRTGNLNANPWIYNYLKGKGVKNVYSLSKRDIVSQWAYYHVAEKTHWDKAKVNAFVGELYNNFAKSYLENMREVGMTKQMFQNDIDQDNAAINRSNVSQFGKNRNIAVKTINALKSSRLTKAQESQYYEDLGNALLGMQATKNGPWSNGELNNVLNTLKHTKGIDYNRVIATRDNIAKRISQQNSDVENPEASEIDTTTPSGRTNTYTPPRYDAGETQPNPWGKGNDAASTNWSEMSADVLVDRRKQMNKFVRALQEDSDVSQVLSEDPALQRAISKKQVANNADAVIDWYNQQRLAIQKELHKKHLTNTGGWMDPKKKKTKKGRQKSPRKIVNDEISYYLDSLDAYYTDRKAGIEEMQSNGDISEAEGWRRNLQNQQQWQLRRGELQQLYSKKRGGVSQSERDAIYSIIGDRTGETSDMVEGNIQSTISFIRAVGTKSLAEMRAIYGDLDLGMEKSFQRMQKAVADQMSAIKDIVDKERPFNGIIDNLETNITKMGLLQKDFENKRIALERQGVDQDDKRLTDIVRQQREDLPKRLNFLLGEAEHAYEITWDKLADDMQKNGYGSWLDAILNSEDPAEAKRAMMAQLHTVYDDVQDAVKKEADLVKKQVENIWNDSTLLPSNVSIKNTFQRAIDALSVEENGVNRANQLISAGVRSERVADRLAIKQLQIQLDMQTHYYNLVRQTGLQRIEDLQRAAKEKEKAGKLDEAERLNMDARHAQMSLDLSLSEKETDLAKQRAELQDKTDESQARLYKHLQEWSTLLSSSMQGLFEASNTGAADYYNNLAKMRLTGEGSAGGTYVIIDNAGTKDATAHYESLDGEEALKRQLEIEQQNAVADEWKKVMDDINKKINDEITDWMNAQLQNQAIDDNTRALVENTRALWEIIHGKYNNDVSAGTFSRNEDGMAVDKKGNVIYPIEPADTGTKGKGDVPSWGDIQAETEANARNQWTAYSNLAPTNDENGIYRNSDGMAINAGGEIIYPLQPTEAAAGKQTPAETFWPSDIDQTEGYATGLWTAYRDASVQAQTDIAAANAELQSEGGNLAPTLPATEEQTQQMVENIQTVNQAYADSTIQAQQDIADAKAEAGTNGGEDGLIHADGTWFGTSSDPVDMQEVTITAPHIAAADASTAATKKIVENNKKIETSTKKTNKTQQDSTKSTYAAMAQAMNMYGLAYQVMSNDNMSSTQKFLTFALQSAGQVAIAMLTTNMLQTEGQATVELPGILGKAASQLGPIAGPIAFAAMTALLGGLMAVATSKVSKSKTQIAQVTGASVSAGRLSTGMLTYAEGNVNEFTDPSTLTPGQQYNVDAADGHTYRARYMGANPTTHLTNGPEFHLVGERGREAIIDANTTRQLQMNDTGIWQAIQTLYNGGSIRSVRRGGMRNFASGNLDDFADVSSAGMTGTDGSTPETTDVVSSLQASLDRNSDVLERAMRDGIKGVFDIHGKGGLVDSYDRGKKEAKRHGEKY